MKIRALDADDANAWREIRLRMLSEHQEAFGEDPDDFAGRENAELVQRIRDGNVIGAWIDGALVGTVGWFCGRGRKRKHVAEIWGMYVAPEHRRTGAGRALLIEALRASAAEGVEVWELGVEEQNTGARALYEAEGFAEWGIEPDAYRFSDRSVNIIHMSRRNS
ncbi:MAG: GNAT family N-acetyltransferase [Planctomycetes bacterium]|mgnify:CR=1 FL=1|nr:GNAT family N-acetyltransferase [Planctomycetota bacterium]